MPSSIKACTCKHEYQDSRYGQGRRVHVALGSAKNPDKGWKCTICQDVKLNSGAKK